MPSEARGAEQAAQNEVGLQLLSPQLFLTLSRIKKSTFSPFAFVCPFGTHLPSTKHSCRMQNTFKPQSVKAVQFITCYASLVINQSFPLNFRQQQTSVPTCQMFLLITGLTKLNINALAASTRHHRTAGSSFCAPQIDSAVRLHVQVLGHLIVQLSTISSQQSTSGLLWSYCFSQMAHFILSPGKRGVHREKGLSCILRYSEGTFRPGSSFVNF